MTSGRESEIREIAIAVNSDEATDEQFARLDELIRSDPRAANYLARMLDQQAALAWQGAMRGEARDETCGVSNDNGDALVTTPASATDTRGAMTASAANVASRRWTGWALPALAVGIGFVLGGLAAVVAYRSLSPDARQLAAAPVGANGAEPAYEAHLVRSTACLWDGTAGAAHPIGSELASGESLNLLEGLAEFKLNWSTSGRGTVSLEGPAAMMLSSEGMPTLRFGRLTATINTANRPFVLETPVGRLVVEQHSSFGVSAFGNEGEIHVFDGRAILEPAWQTADEQAPPLNIEAGEAIRVQPGDDGQPKIAHHAADRDYFADQVSMSSDGLGIPKAYVNAVKSAKPIGYWRFERDQWPNIPNVMGGGLDCKIVGAIGRTSFRGNQAIEFGVTDQGGEIVSNQAIESAIHDSYSIEFWVKPSHYHSGAMISLVGDNPMPSGNPPHGMLLELGGTGKIPTATHHPGCIRFLHRSPASDDKSGTSCYSTSPYTLRKWQHVVATKEGAKMRLYMNGELVAEGEDASALPAGLRLLIGRLYPSQRVRPFIGQLDELALYNRALSAEEIASHYRIVRPVAVEPHDI
jgi:hypothetical protein